MTTADTDDRIERWIEIPGDPDAVWAAVGGFGAIADWHPALESCELLEIDGETHRRLVLADGGALLERLIEEGPRRYRYEIVDGPLPVADYRSTFAVSPHGGGARVFWSSIFEPTDAAADDIIAGVYEAGLDSIRRRLEG